MPKVYTDTTVKHGFSATLLFHAMAEAGYYPNTFNISKVIGCSSQKANNIVKDPTMIRLGDIRILADKLHLNGMEIIKIFFNDYLSDVDVSSNMAKCFYELGKALEKQEHNKDKLKSLE